MLNLHNLPPCDWQNEFGWSKVPKRIIRVPNCLRNGFQDDTHTENDENAESNFSLGSVKKRRCLLREPSTPVAFETVFILLHIPRTDWQCQETIFVWFCTRLRRFLFDPSASPFHKLCFSVGTRLLGMSLDESSVLRSRQGHCPQPSTPPSPPNMFIYRLHYNMLWMCSTDFTFSWKT